MWDRSEYIWIRRARQGELGAQQDGEADHAGWDEAQVDIFVVVPLKSRMILLCSLILDAARAGIGFFDHQRKLAVTNAHSL